VRSAIGLLTSVGGAHAPSPGAVPWFPVVGAGIGAAVGGAWWATGEVAPPAVAAVVALLVDLALTGMLHVDAVADSADGLLPPFADRERRLEVMADPHAGTFGVVAIVAVVLARWAALVSITPDVPAVIGLWAAGRGAMAAGLTLPSARPGGLGDRFRRGNSVVAVVLGAVAGAVLAGWATVGVVVGAGAVVLLAWRRLSGITGDVVGAAGLVGETVGLLVLAAIVA
jgi:adenosylcobinamide-GDP ribazoletransferase